MFYAEDSPGVGEGELSLSASGGGRFQRAESGNRRSLLAELYRTAPLVHPERNITDALARVKYFVRALATPRLTAEWFAVLRSPALHPLISHPHPLIFCKLQRPYLHRRLETRERLNALRSHYSFMENAFAPALREKIFRPDGCELAVLPSEDAPPHALRLSYAFYFGKEGDLSLELVDRSSGGALLTLTFSVTRYGAENSRELFVGGLQGHRPRGQREITVKLTRSLHGMRPKALLVFALQRFSQLFGFTRIRAVSDEEHIGRRRFGRPRLHSSYNDFWQECQGKRMGDGNFELPAFPTCRNLDEIPPKKRSLYRRRYALLMNLGDEIGRALMPLRQSRPPLESLQVRP